MYLVYGNSLIEIKEKINEIIETLKTNNIIKYNYTETNIDEIIEDACYFSMFGDKKCIIVNDCTFLTSKDKETSNIDNLIKYIKNPNEETTIIFCLTEEKLDERKKITKEIKKTCQVFVYNKKDNKNITSIITENLKKDKYDIEYDALNELLDRCENNKDTILNELDKLKMYKINNKKIKFNDVIEVVPKSLENNIYKLTNAISEKNKNEIFRIYKELINNKIDDFIIIGLLESQFRLFLSIKILLEDGKKHYEINEILKEHPYRIQLGIKESAKFKKKELISYLEKLFEIDKSKKSGELTENNSLEMFLLEMWGLYGKTR